MNRHLAIGLFPLVVLALAGCTSNENLEAGGVPAWLANGAKLAAEPEPRQPDAAIMDFEDESGQVQFRYITDKRDYPEPSQKRKRSSRSERDPIEPGREYRIRRLVR